MADLIVDRQQGIDPVLTALVLGTPRPVMMPSKRIARSINVPNVQFQWRQYGKDALKLKDGVKRGPSAEIRSSRYSTTQDDDKLGRYTYAYEADQAEIANAIGLDVPSDCAFLAQAVVENVIEKEFAEIITAAATYDAGHVVTIAGGNEWDAAGGDSKANINTVAAAISADTRIPISELSVFLPQESYNAALSDPVLLAQLQALEIGSITTETLRRHWGVKEVWTSNSAYADDADDLVGFYGDAAVVYYSEPTVEGMDNRYGGYTFCCEFGWNDGNALEPYYVNSNTTWYFPWERWVKFNVTSNIVAGLILNCAA